MASVVDERKNLLYIVKETMEEFESYHGSPPTHKFNSKLLSLKEKIRDLSSTVPFRNDEKIARRLRELLNYADELAAIENSLNNVHDIVIFMSGNLLNGVWNKENAIKVHFHQKLRTFTDSDKMSEEKKTIGGLRSELKGLLLQYEILLEKTFVTNPTPEAGDNAMKEKAEKLVQLFQTKKDICDIRSREYHLLRYYIEARDSDNPELDNVATRLIEQFNKLNYSLDEYKRNFIDIVAERTDEQSKMSFNGGDLTSTGNNIQDQSLLSEIQTEHDVVISFEPRKSDTSISSTAAAALPSDIQVSISLNPLSTELRAQIKQCLVLINWLKNNSHNSTEFEGRFKSAVRIANYIIEQISLMKNVFLTEELKDHISIIRKFHHESSRPFHREPQR